MMYAIFSISFVIGIRKGHYFLTLMMIGLATLQTVQRIGCKYDAHLTVDTFTLRDSLS